MRRQERNQHLKMALLLWLCVSSMAFVSCGNVWSSKINSLFSTRGFDPGAMDPSLLESVAAGAHLALEHCQQQFQWDRWNCPENAFSRRNLPPNREKAFILALTAAGVMYNVAKNCSRGEIIGCNCDTNFKNLSASDNGWRWGGCHEDIIFGEQVSSRFLDNLESGLDTHAYVNKHNLIAGREALHRSMQKKCRCHGMSGSCSLKSCWVQLPPFEQVATTLRERYDRAVRIGFEKDRGVRALGNAVSSNSAKDVAMAISTNDLLYMIESPDYCQPDPSTGWEGTKGRVCSRPTTENATRAEKRSCRVLCRACGRRVQRRSRQLLWHCDCTFHWCCEVTCRTCRKTVVDYFCS